jgi:hypothetical protein
MDDHELNAARWVMTALIYAQEMVKRGKRRAVRD